MAHHQSSKRSGVFLGILIGMVIGFAASAATALFITKAPVPFVDKVEHMTKPVDASALDGIDPNAALQDAEKRTAGKEALSTVKTVEAPTSNQRAQDDGATGAVGAYTIQAGAFRSQKDAEKVRTDLAFIALEADVVKSTDAGITLYRVILGPFDTAKEANELQQRLTSNGFAAMVVKKK